MGGNNRDHRSEQAHSISSRPDLDVQSLEEKLQQTREREAALRDVNQRMEEFLGAASHELRTPLTTIKANIQLALRRLRPLSGKTMYEPGETKDKIIAAQDMLMRAERQVGVLNRLVGDMIDISRIQSGRLQMHVWPEPRNLVSIVQEIIREQCKIVPGRSILLEMSAMENVPVRVDSERVGQVLTHYIDNALKYSEAVCPVKICIQCKKPSVCVSVQDEGPGISVQEQGRVWECFYQVPDIKAVSGSGVGLGLGLYISEMIIAYHAGRVGVHSVLDKGSTFWFTLPVVEQDVGE